MDKPVTEIEKLKYRIAEEEGLMEKLLSVGWAGLTSAESGKIGGLVAARLSRP